MTATVTIHACSTQSEGYGGYFSKQETAHSQLYSLQTDSITIEDGNRVFWLQLLK